MIARRFVMSTVVLAIVAAGCGGGGLSLQEYLTTMDGLQSSFQQKSEDSQTEVQAALQEVTSNEDALTVFRGYLEESLAAIDEQLAKLEGLDPPSEAESEHEDLLEAGNAIRDSLADVIDRYGEFGSVEEVAQFFTTNLGDAEQQGTDACNALQAVADDNEIDVDLGC
ncbi:MAG TPA: hypothetical protein VGR41_05475 [Actinomycetota bacterium]|jgi:hypothetical protein|nr:hypothetical protein [Actinomycetota bacterium]